MSNLDLEKTEQAPTDKNGRAKDSIILGPIFYHHDQDTFCLILTSNRFNKISLDLRIGDSKTPDPKKTKSLGKIKLYGYGTQSRELIIQTKKCFAYIAKIQRSKKQTIALSKVSDNHFYRLVVDDEVIKFDSPKKSKNKSKFKERHSASGWIGPAHVLRPSNSIQSKTFVSCFDASKRSVQNGGLEKVASSMLKNRKSQSLILVGDQIYADAQPESWVTLCDAVGASIFGITKSYVDRSFISRLRRLFSSNEKHLTKGYQYLASYSLLYGWASTNAVGASAIRENLKDFSVKRAIEHYQTQFSIYPSLFLLYPTVWMWDDHDISDDWNILKKRTKKGAMNQARYEKEGLPPLALIQRPMSFLAKGKPNYSHEIKKQLGGDSKVTVISDKTIILENRINREYGQKGRVSATVLEFDVNNEVDDYTFFTANLVAGVTVPPLTGKKKSKVSVLKGSSIVMQTHPLSPISVYKWLLRIDNLDILEKTKTRKVVQESLDMELMDYYPDKPGELLSQLWNADVIYSGDIHAGYVRELMFQTSRNMKGNTSTKFVLSSAGALKNKNPKIVRLLVENSPDMSPRNTTVRIHVSLDDKRSEPLDSLTSHVLCLVIPNEAARVFKESNSLSDTKLNVISLLITSTEEIIRNMHFLEFGEAPGLIEFEYENGWPIDKSFFTKSNRSELRRLKSLYDTLMNNEYKYFDIFVLSGLMEKVEQKKPNFIQAQGSKLKNNKRIIAEKP